MFWRDFSINSEGKNISLHVIFHFHFEHRFGMHNVRKFNLNFCKGFISCWINSGVHQNQNLTPPLHESSSYLICFVVSYLQVVVEVVACFFGPVLFYSCILISSGSIDYILCILCLGLDIFLFIVKPTFSTLGVLICLIAPMLTRHFCAWILHLAVNESADSSSETVWNLVTDIDYCESLTSVPHVLWTCQK